MAIINSTQLLFDFLTRYSTQKKETNPRSILLFFHDITKTQTCPLPTAAQTKLFTDYVLNVCRRRSEDGAKRRYTDFDSITSG